MQSFKNLSLPDALAAALDKMKFTTPTPIQAKAIPVALTGQDILGSAQTGTGKTGAFGVPLAAYLINNPKATALVMAPTRELAAQVLKTLQDLLATSPDIKSALLIGGDSMFKQLQQLKKRPRLIVGTPGRINDHLEQKTVNLSQAGFLVLDETDRMLDMGFGVQIDRVLKHLPYERQTLLFSATLPDFIVKMSNKYLKNPARIAIGSTHAPIERIKTTIIETTQPEKYELLLNEFRQRKGSIIVFVKTKYGADKLAKKICGTGETASAIHGNLNQSQRNRVIQAFRDRKNRILVATDVAARGLDIPHIEHVVNFDLPQVPEDYIHRLGRTARAGAEGSAVCFVAGEERQKWRAIQLLINPKAATVKKPATKTVDTATWEKPKSAKPKAKKNVKERWSAKDKKTARTGRDAERRFAKQEKKQEERRTAAQKSRDAAARYDRDDERPQRRGEDRYETRRPARDKTRDKPYGEKKTYNDKKQGEKRGTFGGKPTSAKAHSKGNTKHSAPAGGKTRHAAGAGKRTAGGSGRRTRFAA